MPPKSKNKYVERPAKLNRIYDIGRFCVISNCPFKTGRTTNDGDRKFVMWPTDTFTHRRWTKNIGSNYRKDRKTLMICSFHFDVTDPDTDLVRLSEEETRRISDRWHAGGSFNGRLFTTDLLPKKFVNKAENAKILRGLERKAHDEEANGLDLLRDHADESSPNNSTRATWTVPYRDHSGADGREQFGEEAEVDLEADDDVTSPAFRDKLARLDEGAAGVQNHCAVKSCPFNEQFWHVPSHFAFPTDAHYRKQWKLLCDYKEGTRSEHLVTVCSHHFAPNAFFDEDFLRARGYGKLGKRVIKPCARPTLYIRPAVNQVLRQRWHRKKMAKKLTGTTSYQEYVRLVKGGVGKISFTGGDTVDRLEAVRNQLSEDMLTQDFAVDPDIEASSIEECLWRSGIRGTVLQHLEDTPERPKMYTRSEKVARNQAKIEWMEARVAELEEVCLKQKMVIAKSYATIGQGRLPG